MNNNKKQYPSNEYDALLDDKEFILQRIREERNKIDMFLDYISEHPPTDAFDSNNRATYLLQIRKTLTSLEKEYKSICEKIDAFHNKNVILRKEVLK